MGMQYRKADGIIVEGKNKGDFIYCFSDKTPFIFNYKELIYMKKSIIARPGWYSSYPNSYLWNTDEEFEKFLSNVSILSVETLSDISVLGSSSNGPSGSRFIDGALIGGTALGAAAALSASGSSHSVAITFKDGENSVIRFSNNEGYHTFIEKLYSLIDKQSKNEMTISVADEILKFKQLLDLGIITQDEFEVKKKKLLEF